ncbi:zincin-like metallopeptidase toxin domain-containing protein [Bacillus pseudomycoides]
MKQTILQREEHVYNTVMKNKANFTRAELYLFGQKWMVAY